MELPLSQRSEATLEYHVVSPEAAHDRFIVFLARVLTLASIGSAVYPLTLCSKPRS